MGWSKQGWSRLPLPPAAAPAAGVPATAPAFHVPCSCLPLPPPPPFTPHQIVDNHIHRVFVMEGGKVQVRVCECKRVFFF